MNKFKNDEVAKKMTLEQDYKVACKNCGRRRPFYPIEKKDKKICDWCGNTIYRTPEIEFREKLLSEARKK